MALPDLLILLAEFYFAVPRICHLFHRTRADGDPRQPQLHPDPDTPLPRTGATTTPLLWSPHPNTTVSPEPGRPFAAQHATAVAGAPSFAGSTAAPGGISVSATLRELQARAASSRDSEMNESLSEAANLVRIQADQEHTIEQLGRESAALRRELTEMQSSAAGKDAKIAALERQQATHLDEADRAAHASKAAQAVAADHAELQAGVQTMLNEKDRQLAALELRMTSQVELAATEASRSKRLADELAGTISELQRSVDTAEHQRETVVAVIAGLRSTADADSRNAELLKKDNARLEDVSRIAEARADQLAVERDQAAQDSAAAAAELASTVARSAATEQHLAVDRAQAVGAAQTLTQKVEAAEKAQDALVASLESERAARSASEAAITALEITLEETNAKKVRLVEESAGVCRELQVRLKLAHGTTSQLETELEATVTRSDQLQEQLDRHSKRSRDSASTAERELHQLQEDLAAGQTELVDVRAAIVSAERESREESARAAKLELEIENVRNEHKAAGSRLSRVQRELDESQAAWASCRAAHDADLAQLDAQHREAEQLRVAMDLVRGQANGLAESMRDLQDENAALMADRGHKNAAAEASSRSAASLAADLANKATALEAARASIATLTAQSATATESSEHSVIRLEAELMLKNAALQASGQKVASLAADVAAAHRDTTNVATESDQKVASLRADVTAKTTALSVASATSGEIIATVEAKLATTTAALKRAILSSATQMAELADKSMALDSSNRTVALLSAELAEKSTALDAAGRCTRALKARIGSFENQLVSADTSGSVLHEGFTADTSFGLGLDLASIGVQTELRRSPTPSPAQSPRRNRDAVSRSMYDTIRAEAVEASLTTKGLLDMIDRLERADDEASMSKQHEVATLRTAVTDLLELQKQLKLMLARSTVDLMDSFECIATLRSELDRYAAKATVQNPNPSPSPNPMDTWQISRDEQFAELEQSRQVLADTQARLDDEQRTAITLRTELDEYRRKELSTTGGDSASEDMDVHFMQLRIQEQDLVIKQMQSDSRTISSTQNDTSNIERMMEHTILQSQRMMEHAILQSQHSSFGTPIGSPASASNNSSRVAVELDDLRQAHNALEGHVLTDRTGASNVSKGHQEEIITLLAQLSDLQLTNDTLETKLDAITLDKDHTASAFEQEQARSLALQQRLLDCEERISMLSSQGDSDATVIVQLEQASAQAHTAINGLEVAHGKLQANLESVQGELSKSESSVQQISAELQQQVAANSDLESAVQASKRATAALSAELADATTQLNTDAAELAHRQLELETALIALGQTGVRLAAAEADVTALTCALEDQSGQSASTEVELEQAGILQQIAEDELAAQRSAMASSISSLEAVADERRELHRELAAIRSRVGSASARVDGLVGVQKKMKKELAKSISAEEASCSQLQKVRKESDRTTALLRSSIQAVAQKLVEAQAGAVAQRAVAAAVQLHLRHSADRSFYARTETTAYLVEERQANRRLLAKIALLKENSTKFEEQLADQATYVEEYRVELEATCTNMQALQSEMTTVLSARDAALETLGVTKRTVIELEAAIQQSEVVDQAQGELLRQLETDILDLTTAKTISKDREATLQAQLAAEELINSRRTTVQAELTARYEASQVALTTESESRGRAVQALADVESKLLDVKLRLQEVVDARQKSDANGEEQKVQLATMQAKSVEQNAELQAALQSQAKIQAQLDAVQLQNVRSNGILSVRAEQIETTEVALSEALAARNTAVEQLESAQARLEELESKLDEASRTDKAHEDVVRQLRATMQQSEDSIQSQTERIAQLEADVATRTAELRTAAEHQAEMQEQLVATRLEASRSQAVVVEQSALVEAKAEALADLQGTLRTATERQAEMQEQLVATRLEAFRSQAVVAEQSAHVAAKTEALAEMGFARDAVAIELEEANAQIELLRSQQQQQQQQSLSKIEVRDTTAALYSQIAVLEESVQSMQVRDTDKAELIARLTVDLTSRSAARATAQAELDRALLLQDALRAQMAEREELFAATALELNACRESLEENDRRAAAAGDDIAVIQRREAALSADLKNATIGKDKLQTELDGALSAQDDLERELAVKHNENTKLEELANQLQAAASDNTSQEEMQLNMASSEARKHVAQLDAVAESAAKRVADALAQADGFQAERDAALKQVADLNQTLTQAQGKASAAQELRIAELQTELAELQVEQQAVASAALNRAAELDADLSASLAVEEELSRRSKHFQEACERKQKEASDARAVAAALRQQMAALLTDHAQHRSSVESLELRVTNLLDNQGDLEGRLLQLTEQNWSLEQDMAKADDDRDTALKRAQTEANNIAELKAAIQMERRLEAMVNKGRPALSTADKENAGRDRHTGTSTPASPGRSDASRRSKTRSRRKEFVSKLAAKERESAALLDTLHASLVSARKLDSPSLLEASMMLETAVATGNTPSSTPVPMPRRAGGGGGVRGSLHFPMHVTPIPKFSSPLVSTTRTGGGSDPPPGSLKIDLSSS